ncbi:hypothetical protein [Saezia sanguinis]|uniref:hypothetical protein n=1 Tax=Saezia sanguinis TaxID=1965230 RepID=UPI003032A0DC
MKNLTQKITVAVTLALGLTGIAAAQSASGYQFHMDLEGQSRVGSPNELCSIVVDGLNQQGLGIRVYELVVGNNYNYVVRYAGDYENQGYLHCTYKTWRPQYYPTEPAEIIGPGGSFGKAFCEMGVLKVGANIACYPGDANN